MQTHAFSTGFNTNFEYIKADSDKTQNFTLIYTHGFCSDPWGRKPEEIKNWCLKNNISFYRYELAGHGSDAHNLEKADLNIWKSQILEIIDREVAGKVLVAGASLGGWLSLLAATARPERVVGVLGLAAAPDFTKENAEFATEEQKQALERDGKIVLDDQGFKIVITKQLIESGKQNLLLDKPIIPISCPVTLIQGMQDEAVYWQKALRIAEKLQSRDVVVKLLKSSDHRLNADGDIAEILSALDCFIQPTCDLSAE